MQKVGAISVTSVHEFFPTTVHVAWINERVQEKGGGADGVGGGRDGEGVVANTHAPNRECKVGEELIARREKGVEMREGRQRERAKQGKRRRLSGREV